MSSVYIFRIVLMLMWVALWESFHPTHLVVGYLLAVAVTKLFSHLRTTAPASGASETASGG